MPTPIGHGIIGLAVSLASSPAADLRRQWMLAGLCGFYAVAPDLDFVPGFFVGQPALYHQGISHSISFGIGAALIGAAMFHRWFPAPKLFLLLLAAYVSHLGLDLFGPDKREPLGVPLFWPLSARHFLSPVPLLLGVRHAGVTETGTLEWIAAVLSWYNVKAIALELAVATPFLLLGWRYRRAHRTRSE